MQAHATLGSGATSRVHLLIGGLPLRLHSQDSDLMLAAGRRYKRFQGLTKNRFSIQVDREADTTALPHAFACDFEGARVEADDSSIHFSGVRHEYALDSLLRMFLSWALLPEQGFLLHAATVVQRGRAYVFFGRSGAGKSTVSRLSPRGSVLTDEISLLKCVGGEWRAFGTPFWGEFRAEGQNTSAPVAGFFRLVQSPSNRRECLRPAELLKALLPCVLFFSSQTADNERLLQILIGACQKSEGYNLYFQKNRSFWEVLPS